MQNALSKIVTIQKSGKAVGIYCVVFKVRYIMPQFWIGISRSIEQDYSLLVDGNIGNGLALYVDRGGQIPADGLVPPIRYLDSYIRQC